MGASSSGMAAIEGVVAALEVCASRLSRLSSSHPFGSSTQMFDKLRNSIGSIPSSSLQTQNQQNKRPSLVSHVIHFAACPPDSSLNPMWNKDPNYDGLTWKSLPDEFKKVCQICFMVPICAHINSRERSIIV
jgi:hypothetical protein